MGIFIEKLTLPKDELNALREQATISAADVNVMFAGLSSDDLDFKIARVHAKSQFFKELRKAGLLNYSDKFCFIAITRTRTYLWYPFSKFIYAMDKAPFSYNRKEKYFLKRTPREEVPVTRFVIGTNYYERGYVTVVNADNGKYGLRQENTLLREFYVTGDAIIARGDILKAKFTIGPNVVATRTVYYDALEFEKIRPPRLEVGARFYFDQD